MNKPADIAATLAGLPILRGRDETTEAEADASFAQLADIAPASGPAGVFTGSFSGQSPWERHPNGDELVHILDGATTLTIMSDDGPVSHEMKAGMLIVVPRGAWHRFHAPEFVTVLTATPQPTDHTFADDPRDENDSAT